MTMERKKWSDSNWNSNHNFRKIQVYESRAHNRTLQRTQNEWWMNEFPCETKSMNKEWKLYWSNEINKVPIKKENNDPMHCQTRFVFNIFGTYGASRASGIQEIFVEDVKRCNKYYFARSQYKENCEIATTKNLILLTDYWQSVTK